MRTLSFLLFPLFSFLSPISTLFLLLFLLLSLILFPFLLLTYFVASPQDVELNDVREQSDARLSAERGETRAASERILSLESTLEEELISKKTLMAKLEAKESTESGYREEITVLKNSISDIESQRTALESNLTDLSLTSKRGFTFSLHALPSPLSFILILPHFQIAKSIKRRSRR